MFRPCKLEPMRERVKIAGVVVSVVLAFAAFIYGWRAASAWAKASRGNSDPEWRIEPTDAAEANQAWISSLLKDGMESANLNRKAANLTK